MPRMGNKNLQRLIGLLALTALAHPAFCDGEHIEDARQEQQKPTLNPEQCKEGDAYTKESIARGLECHSYFLETLARELKERAESGKPLGSKTDLSKETLTIDVLQDLLLKNGFSLDEANDLIKNIQTFESNYSRIQQDDPEKESKEAEQEKTIKNIFNQIADRIEKKGGADLIQSREILDSLLTNRLNILRMKKTTAEQTDGKIKVPKAIEGKVETEVIDCKGGVCQVPPKKIEEQKAKASTPEKESDTKTAEKDKAIMQGPPEDPRAKDKQFSFYDPTTWKITNPIKVDPKEPDAKAKQDTLNKLANGANALLGGGLLGTAAINALNGNLDGIINKIPSIPSTPNAQPAKPSSLGNSNATNSNPSINHNERPFIESENTKPTTPTPQGTESKPSATPQTPRSEPAKTGVASNTTPPTTGAGNTPQTFSQDTPHSQAKPDEEVKSSFSPTPSHVSHGSTSAGLQNKDTNATLKTPLALEQPSKLSAPLKIPVIRENEIAKEVPEKPSRLEQALKPNSTASFFSTASTDSSSPSKQDEVKPQPVAQVRGEDLAVDKNFIPGRESRTPERSKNQQTIGQTDISFRKGTAGGVTIGGMYKSLVGSFDSMDYDGKKYEPGKPARYPKGDSTLDIITQPMFGSFDAVESKEKASREIASLPVEQIIETLTNFKPKQINPLKAEEEETPTENLAAREIGRMPNVPALLSAPVGLQAGPVMSIAEQMNLAFKKANEAALTGSVAKRTPAAVSIPGLKRKPLPSQAGIIPEKPGIATSLLNWFNSLFGA